CRPAEQLDHGAIECRYIIGLSAGNQVAFGHHLLVHPLGSCIAKICLERRPRRDSFSSRRSSFNDRPRPMTDRGHRLSGVKEGFHELHSLWFNSEPVRIDDSAGQQQRVEVIWIRPVESHIDGELIAPLRKIPTPHPIVLWRNDLGFSTCFIESSPGTLQLDLLKTIGDENSYFDSIEILVSHD